MEDKLCELLNQVNSWLKYAETKNGVLLTLLSAGIWASLRIDQSFIDSYGDLIIMFRVITLFSILWLISSFIPITDKFLQLRRKDGLNLDLINPYFFGDIQLLNESEYLDIFKKGISTIKKNAHTKAELHLANQLINNSKIAYSKFKTFTTVIYIESIGILLSIIIWFIFIK